MREGLIDHGHQRGNALHFGRQHITPGRGNAFVATFLLFAAMDVIAPPVIRWWQGRHRAELTEAVAGA